MDGDGEEFAPLLGTPIEGDDHERHCHGDHALDAEVDRGVVFKDRDRQGKLRGGLSPSLSTAGWREGRMR